MSAPATLTLTGMLTVAVSADVGCTWRAQSGPWAAVAYGDDAAVARHAMNRLIWLADLSVPMFPVMVQIRGSARPLAWPAGRADARLQPARFSP
jgi:hypothetical protein